MFHEKIMEVMFVFLDKLFALKKWQTERRNEIKEKKVAEGEQC